MSKLEIASKRISKFTLAVFTYLIFLNSAYSSENDDYKEYKIFEEKCKSKREQYNICLVNSLSKSMFDEIMSKYDGNGSFLSSHSNKDISPQEVVFFLTWFGTTTGGDFVFEEVKKSIKWSFENLRDENGGFVQKSDKANAIVRSSTFLYSVASSCIRSEKILQVCRELEDEMFLTAKWISDFRRPWFGNHDLAAQLALFQLYKLTNDQRYFFLYKKKRRELLTSFISVDADKGFWPEAPEGWENRLLTEYLQTQIMFLGAYLLINENDVEMKFLFKKLFFTFNGYADFYTLKIDVKDSYAFPHRYGGRYINLVSPSIAWLGCYYTKTACVHIKKKNFLIRYYRNMISNFKNDQYITLHTDSYLRFSIIEQIERKRIAIRR